MYYQLGWRRDLPDHRDYTQQHPAVQSLATKVLQIAYPTPKATRVPTKDLRAYCSPIEDQGQLGCHDDKTEVLTENGWVFWPEYKGNSLLATINPINGSLEFQQPIALQTYEYKGPMFRINSTSLDFSLTPNHRMYIRKWNQLNRKLENNYTFSSVQELGWYCGLLSAPTQFIGTYIDKLTIGNHTYSGDDFLSLLALIISDGWVGGTEDNWNTISFCCFRENRIDMVRKLAHNLGLHEIPSRPNVWKWTDPFLAQWLRANIFTSNVYRSPFKRIPDIVKTANSFQISKFLDFFGDQHKGQNRQFYSSSTRIIDDLQELLLRIGKRSNTYERPQRTAKMADGRIINKGENPDITLTEYNTKNLSITKKQQIITEPYNGLVFCATTPNSTIITRRNKRILISGNSCTAQAGVGLMEWFQRRAYGKHLDMSRLFLYKVARRLANIKGDEGCYLRTTMQAMIMLGVPPEKLWPYKIIDFDKEPDSFIYSIAHKFEAYSYYKLTPQPSKSQLEVLLDHLAGGLPFMFGFTVYSSISNDALIPFPKSGDYVEGGHAIMAVGYDDNKKALLIRNSWGTSWGDRGYGWLPYEYINKGLADDFWSLVKADFIDTDLFKL